MKTDILKVKTWLPLFPGFYSTIYEPDESNEIDYVNQERRRKGLEDLEFNAFEFDYDEYHQTVVKGIVNFIESNFEYFINSIEIEGINSPKEYNFYNDSANIVVTLTMENKKAIGRYISKNLDSFREYLKEKYTSCSGFISGYPNNPELFLKDKPLEHIHKLGSILEFIFRNENKEDSEFDLTVYYSINDLHLSCVNYHELIGE